MQWVRYNHSMSNDEFDITIHQNPADFQKLHSAWSSLLNKTKHSIFQTPEFAANWWSSLGNKPRHTLQLVSVSDRDKNLVGLAPLFIDQSQEDLTQLKVIGCEQVADYLDILIDPDHQKLVTQALIKTILNLDWHVAEFCNLPENSNSLKFLDNLKHQRSIKVKKTKQDVCPVIQLPTAWSTYLGNLGRKDRHEIRRKWRKLHREAKPHFWVATTTKKVEALLPQFIKLHQASSRSKKRFWTNDHLQFFQTTISALAKKGWVRLYMLEVNNQLIASMLIFDYQNQFLLYNSGYDAKQYSYLSPGSVLITHTIKDAIEHSLSHYDFMRGDEKYKFRYGAKATSIYKITLTRQD